MTNCLPKNLRKGIGWRPGFITNYGKACQRESNKFISQDRSCVTSFRQRWGSAEISVEQRQKAQKKEGARDIKKTRLYIHKQKPCLVFRFRDKTRLELNSIPSCLIHFLSNNLSRLGDRFAYRDVQGALFYRLFSALKHHSIHSMEILFFWKFP